MGPRFRGDDRWPNARRWVRFAKMTVGFVSPKRARPLALMLRSIAARGERRRFHSPGALRCVSKHEGALNRSSSSFALAGPIPVFSCFSADSESSIPGLTISNSHTSSFPRRVFAPGVLQLCFTHPESRGGRSAEKRSAAAAPVGHAVTQRVRRLRVPGATLISHGYFSNWCQIGPFRFNRLRRFSQLTLPPRTPPGGLST
jgi:hypothetical protein